ncbi:hypothetical protein WAI453_008954 [Rhynchosporium graminicola]
MSTKPRIAPDPISAARTGRRIARTFLKSPMSPTPFGPVPLIPTKTRPTPISSSLLSAPLASEVTTSIVTVVAQQGQTTGGVPPALVLGLRRAS